MHLPGFTAQQSLCLGNEPYRGRTLPTAGGGIGGNVVPARFTPCQLQCRWDATEIYFDCMSTCTGSYCPTVCGNARDAYITKCYAQC